jgi:hypothetical protein
MSKSIELQKASMAFQLKGGEIIWIDKEDVQEIAMKIIAQGTTTKQVVMLVEKDKSIEKANMLYDILKNGKGLTDEIRESYLKQIGILLGNADKVFENVNGEEIIVSEIKR